MWAAQYIAAATATSAIGTALGVALQAYSYYGYAQMAVGAIRAIEGGGTAMANFAGGMAKGYAKSMLFNGAMNGLSQLAGGQRPANSPDAPQEVNNTQGSASSDSFVAQTHPLRGIEGEGKADLESLKDQYDITKPPKHIEMRKGLSYSDLPDAQKYAVHMADEALAETIQRAQASNDPQMKGVSHQSVKAVWYDDPNARGAWSGLDRAYAMGSYRSGENIQFNGRIMVQLLPGGSGLPGGINMLQRGYFAVGHSGIPAGKGAFNYVVAHEVGHTTYLNSRVQNAESNADSFYLRLFGR
jgi:hypothetical protein